MCEADLDEKGFLLVFIIAQKRSISTLSFVTVLVNVLRCAWHLDKNIVYL